MSTVTFIGAGSFGTALSTIVAAKGCRVNIFNIDKAHLDRMESAMENVDYLPGVKLSGDFHFYTDNEAALKDADVIHHCMNDLAKEVKEKEKARFAALCEEFGM